MLNLRERITSQLLLSIYLGSNKANTHKPISEIDDTFKTEFCLLKCSLILIV